MCKIVFLTGAISRKAGGLFSTMTSLTQALQQRGCDVVVLGWKDEYSDKDISRYGNVPVRLYRRTSIPGLSAMGYSTEINQFLEESSPDIIHQQGMWLFCSSATTRYKRRHPATKVIIEPHGMLDPWAMRQSWWKKRLALWLYEGRNLKRADVIHALCANELRSIRYFGLKQNVGIIPNGVDLPDDKRNNISHRKRMILLYLGRLHPKKGLAELIDTLILMKSERSNFFEKWELRIAGWNQGCTQDILEQMVSGHGLAEDISFIGPIYGDEKDDELRNCDAFILPSYSEGLPMSVLEAWSYGKPVLMTEACNLQEGFSAGAAIKISNDPKSLKKTLSEFGKMDEKDLRQMGENGLRLVSDQFTWENIAAKTEEMYRWLMGDSSQPEFISM